MRLSLHLGSTKGLPPSKHGGIAAVWGLIVLCLCGTGCNRAGFLDAREQNDRRVARAYELLEEGQYPEAGNILEQVLEVDPNLVRPHLDLALLLHDQGQDYIRAIYHYRRYLDLRPATEKRDMVEDRIRQAALAFYKRVKQELEERGEEDVVTVSRDTNAADSDPSLQQQNATLTAQLDQAREQVSALEETNRIHRVHIKQMQEKIDRLQSRKLAMETEERVPVPDAATSDDAASEAPPRTYTVRPNDSLSVIAHRVYGDATKWRLIQRANREVLGDSVALRIGQVLVIP